MLNKAKNMKTAKANAKVFLKMYNDVRNGDTYSPRGQKIREVRNYSFSIDPAYPLTSFKDRKLNLKYLAAELCWYLRGDRFDLSICEYGSMWKSLVQKDGGLNSNYGQTIFGVDNQFGWVVRELINDNDSRRAVMVIGEKDYLCDDVNDQRCCQYIQFMIRNNKLECYTYFRSNDVVWGVSNDIFTIVEIFKFVYLAAKSYIPNLQIGTYNHTATSLHVYEKHYEMVDKIILSGMKGFEYVPLETALSAVEYGWLRGNSNDTSATAERFMKYTNQMMGWVRGEVI